MMRSQLVVMRDSLVAMQTSKRVSRSWLAVMQGAAFRVLGVPEQRSVHSPLLWGESYPVPLGGLRGRRDAGGPRNSTPREQPGQESGGAREKHTLIGR